MKKVLNLLIIPIISLFFVTEVKAEEIYLEYQENFSLIQEKLSSLGKEEVDYVINSLIDYYKSNYKNDYSHYIISIFNNDLYNLSFVITIFNQFAFDDSHFLFSISPDQFNLPSYNTVNNPLIFAIDYDDVSSSFSEIYDFSYALNMFTFSPNSSFIYPYNYYYSNFDFYYIGSYFSQITYFDYLSVDDTIYVPLYDKPTTYSVHKADEDFLIEPYYLYDDNSTLEPDIDTYVTINLNDYSYVALSLKNYDVEAFDSTLYVKGQLCPTKLYNYGLSETTVTDRCNIAYTDFTPVRLYTSEYDINNHLIYYLKAYDTSIENEVKVNTDIFNIHYITEEEKDNPILNINGKNYTTIPYDELSSTATKNEAENFVPGAVEDVTVESFFEKPLELLKSVWSAIQSIFSIITQFILLLPPVMQGFLYTAFGIAIVLGLIKILL